MLFVNPHGFGQEFTSTHYALSIKLMKLYLLLAKNYGNTKYSKDL
jgi:hypothetical protein